MPAEPFRPRPDQPLDFPENNRNGTWDGERCVEFSCQFGDLPAFLPSFERTSFRVGGEPAPENRLHEVIVNRPGLVWPQVVPVALVSRSYVLVQHSEVVETLARAFESVEVAPGGLPTKVVVTEYGSRLFFSVTLPEVFWLSSPDNDPVALTVNCFNSVDGTMALRLVLGWFRLICENDVRHVIGA